MSGNTINPWFGQGITVASGFDLKGAPVDYKYVAATLEDVTAMYETGGYNGMLVFCEEDETVYIYTPSKGIHPFFDFDLDGDITNALTNYPTKLEVANTYAVKSTTLSGYGIGDAYTKTETDAKFANLVGSSKETLDTLQELGAALGNDPNFATTIATQIGQKANSADLAKVATSGNYSDLSGTPTSLPANGGNADTVNGHTVEANVPANAKFTDTVYELPNATTSVLGGVTIGSNITVSGGKISINKANVTSALGYTPPESDTTYTVGTATYSGTTKLYTGTGSNTDGSMTQSAITTALNGKLSTDGTAAKATADASGNNIANTYATKVELANYVTLDGEQSISGTKSFGNITATNFEIVNGKIQFNGDGQLGYDQLGITFASNGRVMASITPTQYSGNAASATKATNDSSGNKIVDTYATKTELNGTVTKVNGKTGDVTLTTSEISEGSNLYYTEARATANFDTNYALQSVTGLSDGANVVLDTDTIVINCGNA